MKKIIVSLFIVPLTACATLFGGNAPVRDNADNTSALAIRITADQMMPHIYFKYGDKILKTDRFGDYYVLFNAAPGEYELSYGDGMDEQHYFSDEMIKQSATTVSKGEFRFMGSFTVKTIREQNVYDRKYDTIMLPGYRHEVKHEFFFYGVPVIANDDTARHEFVATMSRRLGSTEWGNLLHENYPDAVK